MGCCEDKIRTPQKQTTKNSPKFFPRSSKSPQSPHYKFFQQSQDIQIDLQVFQLNQQRIQSNFKQLYKSINSRNKINPSGIRIWKSEANFPTTDGALALAHLSQLAVQQPLLSTNWSLENLQIILFNFTSAQNDIRDFSMLLMANLLINENQELKRKVLKMNIYQIVIPLMKHQSRMVRLLAAGICASLYQNFPKAQRQFLRWKGEESLIPLLQRDGDQPDVLVSLLEYVMDLFLVSARQDVEDQVNTGHLRRLVDAKLVDFLVTIDVEKVRFIQLPSDMIEAVDNIFQIIPSIINK